MAGLADVCVFCVLHLVDLADERLPMVRAMPHAVGPSASVLRSLYLGNVRFRRLALKGSRILRVTVCLRQALESTRDLLEFGYENCFLGSDGGYG